MNESKYVYPDKLQIKPLDRPVNATIRVPGSKSITNRALVLAALASRDMGTVRLEGVLQSEDTELMTQALDQLGFRTTRVERSRVINVSNLCDPLLIPRISAELYVGNSGTTMRFLTALVALGQGEFRLYGNERMHERPIGDLIDGLSQLGADAKSERDNGCPPVIIRSVGLKGGRVSIQGSTSSQFVSALMMIAPYAARETTIEILGEIVSRPYIEMTLRMMREAGVGVAQPNATIFRIPSNQTYRCTRIEIEPDASAASYFFGAAAILTGCSSATNLHLNSIQGDIKLTDLLHSMGCHIGVEDSKHTFVCGAGKLHGISVDMNAISDTVPTLTAVACFAEGPTTIRNVAHIRHKECDRISALCTELRKLGVEVEEYPDGLKITPRPMHGAEIETYNDHRIAMSMALIGLKVPGVVIKNPGCVAKTYPGYWEDFQKLYD